MNFQFLNFNFSRERISEAGLCLFAFLLPWQTRLIFHQGIINGSSSEYLTLSLYGIDIFLIGLFFLFLALQFKNIFTSINPLMDVRGKLIILFLLLNLTSVFWAQNRLIAAQRVGWIFLAIILAWLVAKNQRKFNVIFWFLMGLTVSAWLGVYQFIAQYSFANKWLGLASHNPADGGISVVEIYTKAGEPIRWLRSYGSFDHPNIFGVAMAIGIFLAMYLLNEKKIEKWKKYFLYFAPIGMAAGLFMSLSRSAWIGFFLASAIITSYLLFQKQYLFLKNNSKLFALVFSVIVLLALIYPDQLLMRSGGSGRLEQKSLDDRGIYLQQGESIVKSNFALGTGAGNYIEAVLQKMPNGQAWTYQPVHNVFVYSLSELGIIGFALVVTMIVYFGIISWRNDLFYFAIFMAILPCLMFDHWLWDQHFGILLLGLITGLTLNKGNKLEI